MGSKLALCEDELVAFVLYGLSESPAEYHRMKIEVIGRAGEHSAPFLRPACPILDAANFSVPTRSEASIRDVDLFVLMQNCTIVEQSMYTNLLPRRGAHDV